MTKEEQELLYKELSARLFYGVRIEGSQGPELLTGIEGLPTDTYVTLYTNESVINVNFAAKPRQQMPRPYLRSTPTITEEEYKKLLKNLEDFTLPPRCYQTLERLRWLKTYCHGTTDFFLKHHLNFRLPKHLYIEMPKEMYNKKTRKIAMAEIDTKEIFLSKIYEEAKKMQPTQRKGQSIFNATEILYQVGRVVQMHNGVDCFYDDSEIDKFLDLAYEAYVETINVTQWHKPQFLDEDEED